MTRVVVGVDGSPDAQAALAWAVGLGDAGSVPPYELTNAIEEGDTALLRKLPGIGARTAEKVVATLRGKLAEWALLQDEGYNSVPGKPKEPVNEVAEAVIEALVGLGYRRPEAKAKVDAALERTPGVTDEQVLIREVFRAERAR